MTAQRESKTQWTLAIIVAVGLAIDAYVHLHLASDFAHVKTSTLSQADLFRVEAVAAIIGAIAVLVRRRRLTVGFAFLVAAAGLVAVVLYRYVDIGAIGPIPGMYDPYWAPAEKALSAVAEAVAAVAALLLYLRLNAARGVAEREGTTSDLTATR